MHKDQIVVTYPGAFSALVLKNVFGDDEDCPVFADANNLPYDARLTAPGSIGLTPIPSEYDTKLEMNFRKKDALALVAQVLAIPAIIMPNLLMPKEHQ